MSQSMTEHSQFHNNAVFFIEVNKIHPNPFQPRKEFNEAALKELSESIRMYGILQPLTVTRKEVVKEDGGLATEYELIAGERRLRASKLAGLREVPALIRAKEDDDRVKLELAIIENLQREDLNPVDRARAFHQLSEQFGFKHVEIGKKVGRSREYVSNTIRLLSLPEEILQALSEKKISEGHTRPLMMLVDRPEEQNTLFREIMLKKMTVREAEKISRKIAYDKVRKKDRMFDPDIVELESEVGEMLGTRVHIEPKDQGGKIQIDYFSDEDLRKILAYIRSGGDVKKTGLPEEVSVAKITENFSTPSEENKLENPVPTQDIVKESDTSDTSSITSDSASANQSSSSVIQDQGNVITDSHDVIPDSIQNPDNNHFAQSVDPSQESSDLIEISDTETDPDDTPIDDSTADDEEEYSLNNFSI